MKAIRKTATYAVVVGILLSLSWRAYAQDSTASITGSVTDSSGAAVPDATITITNTQTAEQRQAKTNSSGAYTVTLLPVGTYQVSASREGFKVARQDGIKLNVTDVARADFSLSVGSANETVAVNASTVLLNTENAEVGTTVSAREVSDLPLNGRDFQQLLLLDGTAWSLGGSVQSQFRGSVSVGGTGAVVGAGGGRSDDVGFLIDGLNNRDIGFGSAILIPSIDAIQEFKLQSKNYSAEYGGATTQVQLHFKSGTNALHGTAYEFLRNNDFDAKSFNQASVPRLDQNQFGYSLGGPIFIPKLYDGRNKSFFFANYEGLRLKGESTPQRFFVPTAAQLSGQIATNIIDPLTQLPFPGNQIPADRISVFAKAYEHFLLASNTDSPSGNFVGSASQPDTVDQQNYRFDQNLGLKNSLFFRYSTFSNEATNGALNGTGDSATTTANTRNHAYQVGYTRVFSPNLVNQVTFGYVFADFGTVAPTITAQQLASFGIQGGFSSQPTPEIPDVEFSGNTDINELGTNANFPQIDKTTYYNGADTLTMTRGNHTINAGFSILNYSHYYGRGANLGTWSFDGRYSGDPFADFLLGNPSAITINVPSPFAQTASDAVFTYPQYTWSAYGQDDWKISRRLTVNLGLRYEFLSQEREAQNRYLWFDPTVPGGAECTASKQSALDVGQSGLLQYCSSRSTPKLSFAPRVGFAYLPLQNSDRTVLRAGYGIFYNTVDQQDALNAASNYPYLGSQGFNGTPITGILSTAMTIPAITTLRPVQTSDLGFVFLGAIKLARPYTQNWNLTVEQSVGKATSLELGYRGSVSSHQATRYNLNQPFQYDPTNPLPVSSRRPYPSFGEVFSRIYALSSNYNAAVVKVRHESHSLVATAVYSFSKSLDVSSGEDGAGGNDNSGWAGPSDSINFRRDYGRSSFDIRHRAVFSFVHTLPVGHGERYLGNASRPVDALVGGWNLNGIVTLQSGIPFGIAAGDTQGLVDTDGQHADQVGNPYPAGFHKSATEWFNTAAFAQPAPGFFGNAGRNTIDAPGSVNFDLSAFKSFNLTERVKFQFRLESFNTFNHTNYGVPDFNIQDGTSFGQISGAAPGRIVQLAGKVIF